MAAFPALIIALKASITGAAVRLSLVLLKPLKLLLGMIAGRVSQGPAALPVAYRVLPIALPFVVPGFERQHRPEDYTLAPTPIDSRTWFDVFASRVKDAVGRRYLPICRMADGVYEFLFGPKTWNLRLPPMHRAVVAARVTAWRWRNQRPGFHAQTAPGISSGDLTDDESQALRPVVRNDLCEIGCNGILAMHLAYGREPFHEAYFPALRQWVQQGHFALNHINYVPFYSVYALLREPASAGLLGGKRLLVVHSAEGAKQTAIRRSLLELGADRIDWLGISPTRAFAEQLDVRSLAVRPDLCLVGAGIGKTRILRQLEPLGVPCIDAGFTFEVWADADRQWDRPFMTPDTAFSAQRVRYLPPRIRAADESARR